MAHFAQLDTSNTVTRVVVIDNAHETDGVNWCQTFFGGGVWVRTSYNATIRKNYAGVGYTYDPVLDAFIAPQPYPSWTLDTTSCRWGAPTPYPSDGLVYSWDEVTLRWVAA